MATPRKSEILSRAAELFLVDSARHGSGSTVNPEESELVEGGFVAQATSELMTSLERKNAEWMPRSENFEKEEHEEPEIQPPPFNVSQAIDTGFFVCGTSQSGKSNLAKWLVAALMRAGIIVYVIDPSRVWLHDTPIRQVIEIVEMRGQAGPWFGSTVFDISTLDSHDQIAFTNTLCKYLNQQHIDGETICKEFVVFEEAQTYLPNGCMRLSTRKNNPLEGVLKLVTVGANYGLRFGLITQFPAMVDKAPVKISQQRYFGWTWEKNDVQYLKAFLGKEWAERLGTLQKGEFLCQNRMSISRIRTGVYGQTVQSEKHAYDYQWNFAAKVVQECKVV